MEKRAKRETRQRDAATAGRVFRTPVRSRAETPKPDPGQAQGVQPQVRRTCHDCVYCRADKGLWLRTLMSGFPVAGLCANHADAPGQLREITPGRTCRNFRAKPQRVEPPEPPNDTIRYIPLTRGLHAIVDTDDHEWLSRYKWYARKPTPSGRVYAARGNSGATIFMHRFIMKPPEGMVVDHINGNGVDNRRGNLRICTPLQNSRNRRKHADGKSRFIGVSPCGKKWQVFVGHRYVGVFADEVEAAKARDRKAIEMYGEHAWLNFPLQRPPDDGP